MRLPQIEGYAEAVRREHVSRCASYLALPETVCGFSLRAMTVQDYTVLQIMDNPLLSAAVPTSADLAAFLWFMSPEYSPTNGRARRRITGRMYRMIYPRRWFVTKAMREAANLRAGELMRGVQEYLKETFQDSPASTGAHGDVSYYSDTASICGLLASEYGWSESDILKLPMRRVFQYVRDITARKQQRPVFFNPSDALKSRFAETLNTKN